MSHSPWSECDIYAGQLVRTLSLDVNKVPMEDRTRLLSDNGPGYVSRVFRDYLGMVGIKHHWFISFLVVAVFSATSRLRRSVQDTVWALGEDIRLGCGCPPPCTRAV